MTILNFAHPLTPAQIEAAERLSGRPTEQIIEVKTQFDTERPFAEQARALVDAAGITSPEWQTRPLLVNLPALNTIAALLLAEMHGRCGYFPAVLRLRPVAGTTPPQFETAEILDLQSMRDDARKNR